MANGKIDLGKKRLLSSTALTKHVAVFGALGLVFGASSASALDPNALPTDPNVVGGAATFNQSGATLNVNQSTSRTVIDWRSFDIGSNATTNFIQPGASSIAVNRVNSSANPTQIQGSLNANGQVWILNPNGVMFGKTAKVDVAGIVASTGNIDSAAFMRGDNRLQFTGVDGGEVSNAGLISVADGGLAAFVAPSVRNSGVIRARVGKVTLAAGTTYTLDLAGDRLVELGLGADNALVDQSGQVLADGSVVTISAKAASTVVDSVVNVSGTVMASGVHEAGGKIILTADNVTTTGEAVLAADGGTNGDGGTIYGYADKTGTYDGTFSAKGGANSGDGGSIETSGKSVDIQSGLRVDATAANGATGSWTIDPDDLTIDGGNVGAYEANLDTANVNLLADNSITLDTDFNTSGQANSNTLNFQDEGADNNLTINLNGKITLAASQSLTGDGTSVNVGSAGSIQNGVDVVKAGGTVNVRPGDYTEGVTGAGILGGSGPYDFGLYITKDDIILQGVDATGTVITDPTATLATITSDGQSVFGAQNWVSGDGVTIQGLKFLPGAGLDNKLLEVVGDNFTLRNSVLDVGDNGTESALYINANGAGPVESFNIVNNIFYGGNYTGTDGGGIVKIASGAGLTEDVSARVFDGNTVAVNDGHGTSDTVGFQIQGQEDGVAWQVLKAGAVTLINNTFTNIDTPIRTVGTLVEDLAWNDVFRNNGNTFTGGAVMVYAGDTTDARVGTVQTYYDDPTPSYAIFAKIADAVGFNGLQAGDTVRALAGTYAGNVNIDKGLTLVGAGMDETYFTGGIDLGTISDLMFYDFTVSGASDDAVVKSGKVTNFTMDGVRIDGENVAAQHGFASGKFYGDIAITNSEFVNIRGWSSFDNSTGSSPTDLTSVNFSNNLLDNTVGHITFRGAPADAPVTIANNTVRNVGDTTYLSGGIFKVFGADTVDFVNNTISGIGAIAGKIQNGIHDGAALIVRDVATLNVTGNTFTDNQEAILVDNGKTLPTTTNFADNTFTNNAYDINFGNGVGAAEVNFSAGNTFTSGAQSQQFLIMGSSSDVDMTNVQFDGKLGSAMTNAELFALEDHITHGLDNAATGLVTVKADNVYVTENSGSIQRGVDKVTAGDTVNVDAGTFDDALNITKNVDIIGAGAGQTFLMPTSLLATGVTHKYTSDMQATIFVNGADDVNISGITIDGNGLSNDALVFWNNSSGSISDAVLRNVRPFSGAQTGQGIAVDGSGGTVDLTVTNVTIQDYNKNAIDVINGNGGTTGGSDITLRVNDSTLTGRGETGTIAQNGVVLWERAGGTINASIDGTTITDLGYNGPQDATAAGVLVYGSPNGTTSVSNSTFTNVQDYIDNVAGSVNEIDATAGNTFDGVAVSTATLDQIYTIVGHIGDGLTDAGNGLVRLVANNLFLTEANGDIASAVSLANSGDTVNMQAGSFDLGTSQLNINKGLTLTGAGVGATNISTSSTGYGISVSANNVTLSGFTFNANPTGSYSIKVSPGGASTNRLTDFAIDYVSVIGSKNTGLDLNGVLGATIDNVTVTGTTSGNGISLTDSANVAVTNVETSGNAWGGLAIYQANRSYDQQVDNISIDASNSFGEANPVYMQDESASQNIGTVNIAGFSLAGHNDNPADKYTFLNNSVTGLADWLQVKGQLAGGYVTGWTGSAANNEFYVGHATDTTAMSVNAAVDNAASGAVINVAGGNYAQASQVNIDKDMTIVGNSGAKAVFTPGANFTGTSAASAWFLVDPDVNFGVSNVVFDGSGWQVVQALRSQGNTTVNNVDFRNIASSGYMGFAIEQFGGTVAGGLGSDTNGSGGSDGHLVVTNSTFTNIGRVGIEVKGDGSTADITGNTFTGKGAGDWLDYAVEVGASGQADIIANTITNNRGVALSDGSTSAGVLVTSYYGGASTAILQNNFINGNTSAVALGYNNADVSVVHANNNDLSGNEHGVNSTSSSAVADFEYNWWGFTNQSAVDAYMGGDAAASVDSTPFLKSGTDTSPATIGFQGNFAQTSENVNPAQIIVEGFTLPEGAIVTSSGGIILPRGMLIGLVSPAAGQGAAGGKPKVTIVHSVQMLGELLAEGYVAIVVDLEGTVDDEEEIALN